MSFGPLVPVDLRCAQKDSPLGVEADRVRFSWRLAGGGVGRRQTAYQVQVGLSEGDPGQGDDLVWDSGQIVAGGSSDVAYAGTPLRPARCYYWRTRAWDEAGREGPGAPTRPSRRPWPRAAWEQCRWIGLGAGHEAFDPPSGAGPVDAVSLAMKPAPYFRRTFVLDKEVSRARLHVTALGIYQARLNGAEVSDNVLAPGWTDYTKRLLYQTYDVGDLLVTGDNVIAAVVADGWACGFYGFDGKRPGAHYARDPQLLAQLVVTFVDGSELRVVTDQHWQSSTGMIRHADLLMGERRDASREPKGWDKPGYDAGSWRAVSCRETDRVLLVADPGPPIRVTEEVQAKAVNRAPGGELLVDFGQNLAGWAGSGSTGPQVRISPSATGKSSPPTAACTSQTSARHGRQTPIRRLAGPRSWSPPSPSTASVTPKYRACLTTSGRRPQGPHRGLRHASDRVVRMLVA